MITLCSSGQIFLLQPHHFAFLQVSFDDLLIDSSMKIFDHSCIPGFCVINLLLPLSSICCFLISYFCPLLVPVMIFCIAQFIALTILLIFIDPSSSYGASCSSLPLGVPASFCFLFFHLDSTVCAVFSLILCSLHEWLLFFSVSLCFRSSFSSVIYSSWIFHDVLSFLLLHVLKSPLNTWFYVPMATATSDSVTKASTEFCSAFLVYHITLKWESWFVLSDDS